MISKTKNSPERRIRTIHESCIIKTNSILATSSRHSSYAQSFHKDPPLNDPRSMRLSQEILRFSLLTLQILTSIRRSNGPLYGAKRQCIGDSHRNRMSRSLNEINQTTQHCKLQLQLERVYKPLQGNLHSIEIGIFQTQQDKIHDHYRAVYPDQMVHYRSRIRARRNICPES